MIRFLLIVIFLSFCFSQAFSQVFSGKKNGMVFFVDVHEKAAHVEIFSADHSAQKRNEEMLKPVNAGDTVFAGKENHLVRKGSRYRLVYSPSVDGRTYGIKLKLCANDSRAVVDNSIHTFEVELNEDKPERSFADTTLFPAIAEQTISQGTKSASDSINRRKAIVTSDSVITRKIRKDTLLRFTPTSAVLYTAISNAGRHHQASKHNDVLYVADVQRPENLLAYNDNLVYAVPEVLNELKVQQDTKELIPAVKAVSLNSPVAKIMLRPVSPKMINDSLSMIWVALVIVTEISAVLLLAYWIFRSNSLSF